MASCSCVNDGQPEGARYIRMRIGLHRSDAMVGNFGSDKRSDDTCVGPSVNLVARVESADEGAMCTCLVNSKSC